MLNVNLEVAKKIGKGAVKYAGPIATGVIAVVNEIDAQKLRNTVKAQGNMIKELAEKVSKLEKR